MAPSFLKTFTFDEAIRDTLQSKLLHVPSPYEDIETFALVVRQILVTTLPLDLQRELRRFCWDPDAPGAYYLRTGVRDPGLPETPRDGGRAVGKPTFISEGLAVGCGEFSGRLFGYYHEKQGELIHNIVPVAGSEHKKSNESSKLDFGLHVDNAAVEPQPAVLVLSGVRGDAQGEARTYLVDFRALAAHLDADTVTPLREPAFEMHTPDSFAGDKKWVGPRPALSGPPDAPEIWLNLIHNVRGTTPQAKRALAAVARAVQLPGVIDEVCLAPGDVLIINNRRVMHGRRPFVAQYTGTDRWVQRVYIHPDLWPWRQPGASPWLF
jgi:L-asparagine oxygenase